VNYLEEEAEPSGQKQRVLVVGCGGLGGIVAASLLEQAALSDSAPEVTVLATNPDVAKAVIERGFCVRGVDGARTVHPREGAVVRALGEEGSPSSFDWIVLATQPTQVEAAAKNALPYLSPHGAMVCLQNGLCEERIAKISGDDRVFGAVVAWGATMVEPGLYDRTSAGGFTVGRMDGQPDKRLAKMALWLEPIGPVTETTNLAGARYSKLAINCAISTLGTLGGKPLGALMLHRVVRRLALEIMTEAVHIARAEKVRLEKVSGTIDMEWIALTESERQTTGGPALLAKHGMLLAVGARYRRLRSSMLSAIERGRPPAVDFLNGEIVERGRRHRIATPFNREAQKMVHEVASGKLTPSMGTIEAFARRMEVRTGGAG
jgi:2-dehydropantoate 2-reductase